MFSHVRCSVPGVYLAIKSDLLLFSVLSMSACYVSPGPHDPLLQVFICFTFLVPLFLDTHPIYWLCFHLRVCLWPTRSQSLPVPRAASASGQKNCILSHFTHKKREAVGFNFTFVSLATQTMKPADKIPNQSQIHFKYKCLIALLLW